MNRTTWLREHGLDAWRKMVSIRELEQRLADYSKAGHIRGSSHPSVGMEAVAVGVSFTLGREDIIASTHRGHAHCLAKGAEPAPLLAEIFGRSAGYCGGKGGSMHVGVRELGILGTNGIVGASIGMATGAALAAQYRKNREVAVAYFGDGATNQGLFHEALNLAAIWKLPVVYVCENNHYAQSASADDMIAVKDLSERAAAFAIPGIPIDGMDVIAVVEAAQTAVDRARAGEGPSLIVADTYRYLGHMVGDTEIYRTEAEREEWKLRDPIRRVEEALLAEGLGSADQLRALRVEIAAAIDAAEATALASPVAPASQAFAHVYG